jgi:hypothetical protein
MYPRAVGNVSLSDIQRKFKPVGLDEVTVGQKEETARTSNFIILG